MPRNSLAEAYLFLNAECIYAYVVTCNNNSIAIINTMSYHQLKFNDSISRLRVSLAETGQLYRKCSSDGLSSKANDTIDCLHRVAMAKCGGEKSEDQNFVVFTTPDGHTHEIPIDANTMGMDLINAVKRLMQLEPSTKIGLIHGNGSSRFGHGFVDPDRSLSDQNIKHLTKIIVNPHPPAILKFQDRKYSDRQVEVDLENDTGRDLYEKIENEIELLNGEMLYIRFFKEDEDWDVNKYKILKKQDIKDGMQLQILIKERATVAYVNLEYNWDERAGKPYSRSVDHMTRVVESMARATGVHNGRSGITYLSGYTKHCEVKLARLLCPQDEAERAILKICNDPKWDIDTNEMSIRFEQEDLVVPPIVLVRAPRGSVFKVPIIIKEAYLVSSHGYSIVGGVKQLMGVAETTQIKLSFADDKDRKLIQNKTLTEQDIKPMTRFEVTVPDDYLKILNM